MWLAEIGWLLESRDWWKGFTFGNMVMGLIWWFNVHSK